MRSLKPGKTALGPFAAAIFSTVAALGLSVPALAQMPASPPGANCVEIVPAQPGAAPAILLDKCSGQTWQLLRSSSRRYGVRYSWDPLSRQDAAPPPPPPRVSSTVAAPPRAAPGAKCSSFNGRTFCE